ncbi:MAG: SRPBCC domain-containing protein [Devosia sp.]
MSEPLVTENIVVTRLFDAPIERVWRAWTTDEDVQRWWGPDTFTAPTTKMDVREGSTSLVCMRSPDAQYFWMTWDYAQVIPNERLQYVQNLTDNKGRRIDPTSVGMGPEFPRDVATTVTLVPEDGKTRMTITETTTTTAFMMKMSTMGLEQCMDKMGKIFL